MGQGKNGVRLEGGRMGQRANSQGRGRQEDRTNRTKNSLQARSQRATASSSS